MAGFQQLRVTRELDVAGAALIGLGQAPGTQLYVDTTLGNDGNEGLGWGGGRALKTIGQAMTDAKTLTARGRVQIFVAPGGYGEDVVTPLNVTTTPHPFGQLIAFNPTPSRSFGAAYIYASSSATTSLIVRARGWLITGFEIGAVASAGCVWLDGSTTSSSGQGTELCYCIIGGWGVGIFGIDVTGNGAPHSIVHHNHFNGIVGPAIKCSSSGTDQPRFWDVYENHFVDNSSHINMNPRGFKESWIHHNVFMEVGANRTATEQIDNTGGSACAIGPGNFLSDTYDAAGGYIPGSNEDWYGNYAGVTGGVTKDNP